MAVGPGAQVVAGGMHNTTGVQLNVPLSHDHHTPAPAQVVVPALQLNAKDLLFGESVLHGDYWPRYHTYLSKGGRAWKLNGV